MFHSARLKLTGWYLLIIMLVSISFSIVIYIGTSRELGRGFRQAEMRYKTENLDSRLQNLGPRFFLVEDLEEAKKRVGFQLLMVNGVVLLFSAGAGYFLAGRTLTPIGTAMEKQKRFVADASHEFRTPLTALKTSMEVALRNKRLSLSEAKKVIKSNLKDVDGLQSLGGNLLNLTNLQSNGQNLVFKDIDIAQVFKNAHRKILPLAKEKNIEIKTKVKKQNIQANREGLEEMMLIFLDNAVKYSLPKGKVMVRTKTDKKYLILEIKDMGIGITKKDIPYIFDRFYRADQSRSKESVPGYGLGLSLAKRIIEIHKGSVAVSSALDKGTTFTIRLPLRHS